MSAIVVVCGRMFDGSSEELTGPAEIVVEGNRIASIGRSVNRHPGARVIDLSDRTVSPGFIDTHVHLTMDAANLAQQTLESSAAKVLKGLRCLASTCSTVSRLSGRRGTNHMQLCTHLNEIRQVTPRTPQGCEECLKSGDTWVRLCLDAGMSAAVIRPKTNTRPNTFITLIAQLCNPSSRVKTGDGAISIRWS